MRFEHPEMALWLLALPAIGLFWIGNLAYRRHSRRREGVQRRFASISRRSGYGRDFAVLVLACAAVSQLVGAAARPQLLVELHEAEFEKQDLVLILDRSVSMRARDVAPSRAERALTELKAFLKTKPEEIDRIGLVGFAGSPLILSYLTRDIDSLRFYLDWMGEDPAVFYGTDIGAAITSALEVVARDKQPSRKLFLVVSDGDDDGTTLNAAVSQAKRLGIRVHTIGIGAGEATLIPISRPGERDVFLRDDAGRLVKTTFNEASLRAVASATAGRYVRSETGGELVDALETVVHADRRRIGTRTTYGYRDIHPALLAGALVTAALLVAIA
jgi:Ca-activated chloride channel family protein